MVVIFVAVDFHANFWIDAHGLHLTAECGVPEKIAVVIDERHRDDIRIAIDNAGQASDVAFLEPPGAFVEGKFMDKHLNYPRSATLDLGFRECRDLSGDRM